LLKTQQRFETLRISEKAVALLPCRTCQSITRNAGQSVRQLFFRPQLFAQLDDVENLNGRQWLLSSMNRRVKLQLRMQQTVRGPQSLLFPIIVVGFVGYLAKAIVDGFHLP